MNDADELAIQQALTQAGLPTEVRRAKDLSGGCIHRVAEITLGGDSRVVAKLNHARQLSLFEDEAAGLRALAETGTVLVPEPLACIASGDTAVLLMTAIQPGRASDASWIRFGQELAALHACDAGNHYGFGADNHLGTTFQPNTWCDDWVDFNARYRLGYQIDLAGQHGRITSGEAARLGHLLDRLEEYLPRRPKPALLHGDLWSGNALPSTDPAGESRIAMIDPACSVGDGWADIAMMKLFGGFSASCFEAYMEAAPDRDRINQRIAVYQLYHVLNHVNLFGRGYAGQAMSLVGALGG